MTAQLSPESLHNLRHNHLWSKVFYIAIVKNICVKYYFQIITAILSSRMDFTFKKCKKWQVQAPVAAGWAAAGWAVSVVRCDEATVTMSPLTKTCTSGGPCIFRMFRILFFVGLQPLKVFSSIFHIFNKE